MNIQKYMAFVKTVEFESFTKAAKALGYTQSGISHMINDLEREWGLTLLERNRSGIRVTSDGLQVLPYIKAVCDAQSGLQHKLDELHDIESGLIRVGTFSSVATHWLPGIIKSFQKEYKNIEFELLLGDYEEIEAWIGQGRVDCGFLRLPCNDTFESMYLEEDKLLVILPEGHALSSCEKFPIEALGREPFMLLEKNGKADVSEIFQKNHISPNIKLTTWDDYAIMSMVESGMGISILPELILKRTPYRIIKKELEIPAFRKIGIALKDSKTASLAVKRFMDFLKYRNENI